MAIRNIYQLQKSKTFSIFCICFLSLFAEGRRYLKKRFRNKNETNIYSFHEEVIEQKPRIVGGEVVESINEYSFMASVQTSIGGGDYRHICGGSLIAPDIILTAAHCAQKAFLVQLNSLNSQLSNDPTKAFRVVQKRVHPQYSVKDFNYDFALFKLERENRSAGLVRLRRDDNDGLNWMKVAGWGKSVRNGETLSARLKDTDVQYVPNKECEKSYGGNNLVSDIMTCAIGRGTDTCLGDSGGPMLRYVISSQEGNSGYWEQVGVISWGYADCANSKYPGVSSKVSAAVPWIEDQICNKVSGMSPSSCVNGSLSKNESADKPSSSRAEVKEPPKRQNTPQKQPEVNSSSPQKKVKKSNMRNNKRGKRRQDGAKKS